MTHILGVLCQCYRPGSFTLGHYPTTRSVTLTKDPKTVINCYNYKSVSGRSNLIFSIRSIDLDTEAFVGMRTRNQELDSSLPLVVKTKTTLLSPTRYLSNSKISTSYVSKGIGVQTMQCGYLQVSWLMPFA